MGTPLPPWPPRSAEVMPPEPMVGPCGHDGRVDAQEVSASIGVQGATAETARELIGCLVGGGEWLNGQARARPERVSSRGVIRLRVDRSEDVIRSPSILSARGCDQCRLAS